MSNGAKQSTRRGAQPDKTANRTVLRWSGMADTKNNGPYER